MPFFQTLLATPPHRTRLSRYTEWNGWFYLAFGALLLAAPATVGLFGVAPLQGQEPGLVRLIGFVLAIVGWFYVIGARTNADSFGLATVADRVVVPFVLIPLGVSGAVDLALVLPLAILDPLLGLGALAIWRSDRRAVAGAVSR